MQGRTFLRMMMDTLFINNALCKSLAALINFCKEQNYYNRKELKFLNKMPLNNISEDQVYKNKFLFNTDKVSGLNIK